MKIIKQLTYSQAVRICIVASLVLSSCSTENVLDQSAQSYENISAEMLNKNAEQYPKNTANPYDEVGQLSVLILDDYLELEYIPSTTQYVIDQVEAVASVRLEYLELLPSDYASPTSTLIDSLLLITPTKNFNVDPGLSLQGKLILTSFLDSVLAYKELEKDEVEIMEFIYNYEAAIVSNSTLNSIDKKILFTTTSITRYGLYFAKRRPRKNKDRDWEISWGNMYAAAVGSKDNLAKAVIVAVTVGILFNE